jgi:hypothetical protein
MPLPTPLKKSAPKAKKQARTKSVMAELSHGPVTAPSRKVTTGAQRQRQNVAVMLKNSGQSNKAVKPKKKK